VVVGFFGGGRVFECVCAAKTRVQKKHKNTQPDNKQPTNPPTQSKKTKKKTKNPNLGAQVGDKLLDVARLQL
jgi:hypothetical protein